MSEKNFPYWLEEPLVIGEKGNVPDKASIAVVGSGLSGVSAGYFLQKQGFEDVIIIDDEPEKSASYRNCGHILHGTVESMKAFTEIHGYEKAKELWDFSVTICDQVKETVEALGLSADYKQDGYLVVAINDSEDKECQESTKLLREAGFQSEYIEPHQVKKMGFKNVSGARYEPGSAQAHPVKFRNGLVNEFIHKGGKYYSGVSVTSVEDTGSEVEITYNDGKKLKVDGAVLATNAYSPNVSKFFDSRRLVEPFRGQILTSKPLKHQFKVKYPHSFDHGYEYALVTEDNRLMIGGWRNNSPTKEMGTYDLDVNEQISQGLKDFTIEHYDISETIQWEYAWTGIMGASQTSLPFIGPINSERIFSCVGYTGHGFSWAHGSAKLLSDIMAGGELPPVAKYFNPKHRL